MHAHLAGTEIQTWGLQTPDQLLGWCCVANVRRGHPRWRSQLCDGMRLVGWKGLDRSTSWVEVQGKLKPFWEGIGTPPLLCRDRPHFNQPQLYQLYLSPRHHTPNLSNWMPALAM